MVFNKYQNSISIGVIPKDTLIKPKQNKIYLKENKALIKYNQEELSTLVNQLFNQLIIFKPKMNPPFS